MSYFIPPNRQQLKFMQIDLEKLIPEDHPVRFFWRVCEGLEMRSLYEDYKIKEWSAGRPANDPKVILCLWVYGIREGINSTRELAEACKSRADFMWLCGQITPEYRSLAYFRTGHNKAIEKAFCELTVALKKVGLIKMKDFYQDGSKIRANVSVKTFKKRDKLEEELEEAKRAYEEFVRGEVEGEKKRKKIERKIKEIEEAIKMVNKIEEKRKKLGKKDREKYPPQEARASEVDSECQFMKIDNRGEPGYNAQIVVDGESELIVGKGVSNNATDVNELIPMIEGLKENLKIEKIEGKYCSDSGYYSNENIEEAKKLRVENLIMPVYEETKNKEAEEVKKRAESKEGKEALKKRKSIIERIIGLIKENVFKFNRFRLRGLLKVNCEWTLVCIAYNVYRYMKLATCNEI